MVLTIQGTLKKTINHSIWQDRGYWWIDKRHFAEMVGTEPLMKGAKTRLEGEVIDK